MSSPKITIETDSAIKTYYFKTEAEREEVFTIVRSTIATWKELNESD